MENAAFLYGTCTQITRPPVPFCAPPSSVTLQAWPGAYEYFKIRMLALSEEKSSAAKKTQNHPGTPVKGPLSKLSGILCP